MMRGPGGSRTSGIQQTHALARRGLPWVGKALDIPKLQRDRPWGLGKVEKKEEKKFMKNHVDSVKAQRNVHSM